MEIEVKTKDEDGNIIFEGKLSKREVGFLLQFSINELIAAGVHFNIHENEPSDEDQMRLDFSNMGTMN